MNRTRRLFLTGLASLVAAPAIIPYTNLMPVKAFDLRPEWMRNPHWEIAGDFILINTPLASARTALEAEALHRKAKAFLPPGTRYDIDISIPCNFGQSPRMGWYAAEYLQNHSARGKFVRPTLSADHSHYLLGEFTA